MSGRSFDPDYAARIGNRLRDVRLSRGLSLGDVQKKTGGEFLTAALGSWERGGQGVPVHKLASLASLYGVPVADLIPGAQDPDPGRSAASEFPAEMSVTQDSLGRWVLAASDGCTTVTAVSPDWDVTEAFAGLYASLNREKAPRSAA